MQVHKVIHGEGAQTLTLIPHDADGRPIHVTVGTFEIVDLIESETSPVRVLADGNITHDAIEIAIDTSAGPSEPNKSYFELEDGDTLEVGETYLLGDELIVVERIDEEVALDTDAVYTRTAIRNDHEDGTFLRSCRIKCQFPALVADEDYDKKLGGPFMVIWRFESGGVKYCVGEQIFIDRFSERPMVAATDVLQAYPSLATRVRDVAKVEDAISVATDDFLAEVEAAGRSPSSFKTSRAGKMAIRNKAIEYLLRWQQTEQDTENAGVWEEKYRSLMSSLLNGVPPNSTVSVAPRTNTSPRGSDAMQGHGFIRRS